MKLTVFVFLVLLAALARADNPVSTSGDLEFTVRHSWVNPARVFRPGVPEDPDELRRTRYMFTFRARLRNIGTRDVVVPTYLGEEDQGLKGGPEFVRVSYEFILEREKGVVVVNSPVFYRFVTLRPGEAVYLPQYVTFAEELSEMKIHEFVFQVRDEFSERFDCWRGRIMVSVDPRKRPNQAPEPTPMSVTPPAAQEPRRP